jgi:hypothetical protein
VISIFENHNRWCPKLLILHYSDKLLGCSVEIDPEIAPVAGAHSPRASRPTIRRFAARLKIRVSIQEGPALVCFELSANFPPDR